MRRGKSYTWRRSCRQDSSRQLRRGRKGQRKGQLGRERRKSGNRSGVRRQRGRSCSRSRGSENKFVHQSLPKLCAHKRNRPHQQGNANPAPAGDDSLLSRAIECNFYALPDKSNPHPDAKQRQKAGENRDGLEKGRRRHKLQRGTK